MSDEKKHWLESRVKRFTVYGAAFLMLLAVSAGVVGIIVKGYAFAQKVEAITKSPVRLESVTVQVESNGRKLDALGTKVDALTGMMRKHDRRHRYRSGRSTEGNGGD